MLITSFSRCFRQWFVKAIQLYFITAALSTLFIGYHVVRAQSSSSSSTSSSSFLHEQNIIIENFFSPKIVGLQFGANNNINNLSTYDSLNDRTTTMHEEDHQGGGGTSTSDDYMKQLIIDYVNEFTMVDYILFGAFILAFMEGLGYISTNLGRWIHAPTVPVRARHLDEFSTIDYICISFSKFHVAPWSIFYYRFCVYKSNIHLGFDYLTVWNTVMPLVALFVVYDFFYTLFHIFMHIPVVYQFMHKYHHKQHAPSRGHLDVAIIHPLEVIIVHYNYLFALYICSTYIFEHMHFASILTYIILSAVMADLNHTRYDVSISFPFFGHTIKIYDSKDHDIHHRIPTVNFALNIAIWDYIFGTYRSYNPDEKFNPRMQLDPKTGKTIQIVDQTLQ